MFSRRLLRANGISILAVIINHAAGWGFTAMFWWAHRYRPVTSPNYDQLGSLPYYVLVLMKQLTVFSVPMFLFTSAFFIAYAARGKQLNRKFIETRLEGIVIPYIVWSVIVLLLDFIQGNTYSIFGYAQKIALGESTPIYWYVPVICQLYLIAPLITRLAKDRWKLVIGLSALLQFIMMLYVYVSAFVWKNAPDLSWFFGNDILYFSFGIVFGFHMEAIKRKVAPLKLWILGVLVVAAIVTVIEGEVISRVTGTDFLGGCTTIGGLLFSFAVIACFLVFEKVELPGFRIIDFLSRNTFGVYLIHPVALIVTAKLIYHYVPQVLANEGLFQLALIVAAVGAPYLISILLNRFGSRRYSKYIFG